MRKSYEGAGQPDKAGLRELLEGAGRKHLLPLVNVFALAGGALDQIIDVIGRAAIEAVLAISAAEVAGQKQPGKRRDAAYHGRQGGRVYLADLAVRVEKLRLRSLGGEVEIPAYEARGRRAGRADARALAGRPRHAVLREGCRRASRDGRVSKSSVSRDAAEVAIERLEELAERRVENRDYLIVYVDGIQFGGHHVLAALGVDDDGNKRILGPGTPGGGRQRERRRRAGAAREPCRAGPGSRGRARLFVLDGSKALRAAVGRVFGSACLVQRGRNHKMRNLVGPLPRELHDQARSVLRAAWKLDAQAGKARIEQFASWVETQHPGNAGSLMRRVDGMRRNGWTTSSEHAPEGGTQRTLQRQRDRTGPGAQALPRHHERDRQRVLGDAPPNRPRDPVAERVDGRPLGSRRLHGGREGLPEDCRVPTVRRTAVPSEMIPVDPPMCWCPWC